MTTQKLKKALREDTAGIHPRLQLAFGLLKFLPFLPCATLLRLAGAAVGEASVVRHGVRLNGPRGLAKNLKIGHECQIEPGCTFDLEEKITLGDGVRVGHEAMLLTSSHQIGPKEHRAGELVRAPITIEDGACIGARSILLPGVTIGAGAMVSPGSLVNKEVAPHTHVAGNPAKVIANLRELVLIDEDRLPRAA
jgi:maltose O-acetyltransferase